MTPSHWRLVSLLSPEWGREDRRDRSWAGLMGTYRTVEGFCFHHLYHITFLHHIGWSLSTPHSVRWVQQRAWAALDWKGENSIGLSGCPFAQTCHPRPLSLVEWVQQGWRDPFSGESRLWRVNTFRNKYLLRAMTGQLSIYMCDPFFRWQKRK